MRNAGTSKALPTNSTRSISSLFAGTDEFMPIPARKAPTNPSTPPSRPMRAPAAIPPSNQTKRCVRKWRTRAKTQRVARGNTNRQNTTTSTRPAHNGSAGSGSDARAPGSSEIAVEEAATAKTTSASTSVITVAATADDTARLRSSPAAFASG